MLHQRQPPVWRCGATAAESRATAARASLRARHYTPVTPERSTHFGAGIPDKLFTLSTPDVGLTNSKNNHVVAADGQRILVHALSDEDSPPITVVLNWAGVLKK